MTSLRTNNWPSLIQDCVNQLNSRPLQRLHGLAPKDFNTPLDDVKLEGLKTPSVDDNADSFRANQRAYEQDSKQFQVSDMVYADKKDTSTFAKSFNPKVCFIKNFISTIKVSIVAQRKFSIAFQIFLCFISFYISFASVETLSEKPSKKSKVYKNFSLLHKLLSKLQEPDVTFLIT